MYDVLAALQFLHSKDLLHLNLKQTNVLLSEDRCHACLTDFGVAQIINGMTMMTRSIMLGDYAAPELFANIAMKAADVWSFGVLLYEMFAHNPMQPAAHVQFQPGPIILSGIANRRARPLIADCLTRAEDRPTIEWLVMRFDLSLFCVETVRKQIGANPAADARRPAVRPRGKIAVCSSQDRHAAERFPAPPVGARLDFKRDWVRAHRGDVAYQFRIGNQLLRGWSGVERDESAAVSWFQKAAEGGDFEAMDSLAVCYWKGVGVEKNRALAISWFQKSSGDTDISGKLFWCCRVIMGRGDQETADSTS